MIGGVSTSHNLQGFNRVSVTLIIPALNEAENLPYVLARIPDWVGEVILVDGHSTDDTVKIASEWKPSICVITQTGRGKGNALRCGIQAAHGDIVIMLDADGSTDPAEIPHFEGALLSGADVVKGSRFLQGAGTSDMQRVRIFGNSLLTKLVNLLFHSHYTDITYGYMGVWRYCAPALALDVDGWANEPLSCIRAIRSGLRVVEVACYEHRRVAGEAKLQAWSAGWTILKAIVKERVTRHPNSIWESRTVVGDEVFTPAMQMLRRETLALIGEQDHLSPEAYERARQSVRAAYLDLLNLTTDNPDACALQTQYRKRYDFVWGFLENSRI